MPLTPDVIRRAVLVAHARGAGFVELAGMAELDRTTAFQGASMRGIDLRQQDLSGFDFTNADLGGADVRGADLTRAVGVTLEMVLTTRADHTTKWPQGLREQLARVLFNTLNDAKAEDDPAHDPALLVEMREVARIYTDDAVVREELARALFAMYHAKTEHSTWLAVLDWNSHFPASRAGSPYSIDPRSEVRPGLIIDRWGNRIRVSKRRAVLIDDHRGMGMYFRLRITWQASSQSQSELALLCGIKQSHLIENLQITSTRWKEEVWRSVARYAAINIRKNAIPLTERDFEYEPFTGEDAPIDFFNWLRTGSQSSIF